MQQRPVGKALAGLWEFPGGKVEPGETPEAALVRELAEELDIAVDPAALRPIAFATHPADGRNLLLLLYMIRAWRGEPRAIEATALRWAAPAVLRTLPMPPADAPLIGAIERVI
ncbi:(deoxy)nucleoside triphosphate pyrophosphohydrolase [Sphingomonas sp. SUN019]|nr:(deoxy)nucleoside triphosphate pyrophosphohydrolase [Sphingomonas sp. SUN019]